MSNLYQLPAGKTLKPCPFCKTDAIGPTGLYIHNHSLAENADVQHGCFVTCDDCQADGPWYAYDAIDEAIDGWNTRRAQI